MTITTRDQLIDSLANNSDRFVLDKASIGNAVAGQFFSLWRATGTPGQAAIPTTAAVCTSALTGAIPFANSTDPVKNYLAWAFWTATNNGTSLEFHDRLAHMGGLSGTVTTSQGALTLTGVASARIGATNYGDLTWWLEWYADTGSTNVNATVAVTYNDDTSGNLAAIALGATARVGRMFPLVPAVAGKYIKSVTGVTLSATSGTAGNFGITATRPLTGSSISIANRTETLDWAQLGLPLVPNDACLAMLMTCVTTSTGVVRGGGKIAHG